MDKSGVGRCITAKKLYSNIRWKMEAGQSERLVWGAEYTKKTLSLNYLFNKVSQFGFHTVLQTVKC